MIDFVQSGIQGLTFVAYTERAWGAIEDNVDAMRYVGDKILMSYRKTGPATYITYENTFSAIWKKVLEYVKEYQPAGLKWQQGGIAFDAYNGPKAAASNSTAPAPAPPPLSLPQNQLQKSQKKPKWNPTNRPQIQHEEE